MTSPAPDRSCPLQTFASSPRQKSAVIALALGTVAAVAAFGWLGPPSLWISIPGMVLLLLVGVATSVRRHIDRGSFALDEVRFRLDFDGQSIAADLADVAALSLSPRLEHHFFPPSEYWIEGRCVLSCGSDIRFEFAYSRMKGLPSRHPVWEFARRVSDRQAAAVRAGETIRGEGWSIVAGRLEWTASGGLESWPLTDLEECWILGGELQFRPTSSPDRLLRLPLSSLHSLVLWRAVQSAQQPSPRSEEASAAAAQNAASPVGAGDLGRWLRTLRPYKFGWIMTLSAAFTAISGYALCLDPANTSWWVGVFTGVVITGMAAGTLPYRVHLYARGFATEYYGRRQSIHYDEIARVEGGSNLVEHVLTAENAAGDRRVQLRCGLIGPDLDYDCLLEILLSKKGSRMALISPLAMIRLMDASPAPPIMELITLRDPAWRTCCARAWPWGVVLFGICFFARVDRVHDVASGIVFSIIAVTIAMVLIGQSTELAGRRRRGALVDLGDRLRLEFDGQVQEVAIRDVVGLTIDSPVRPDPFRGGVIAIRIRFELDHGQPPLEFEFDVPRCGEIGPHTYESWRIGSELMDRILSHLKERTERHGISGDGWSIADGRITWQTESGLQTDDLAALDGTTSTSAGDVLIWPVDPALPPRRFPRSGRNVRVLVEMLPEVRAETAEPSPAVDSVVAADDLGPHLRTLRARREVYIEIAAGALLVALLAWFPAGESRAGLRVGWLPLSIAGVGALIMANQAWMRLDVFRYGVSFRYLLGTVRMRYAACTRLAPLPGGPALHGPAAGHWFYIPYYWIEQDFDLDDALARFGRAVEAKEAPPTPAATAAQA